MYIPILKSKAGEFQALKELEPDVRAKVLPILEVTDLPWDFENETPATTAESHIKKLMGNLVLHYGTEHEALIDIPEALQATDIGGKNILLHLFESARESDLKLIPVFSLSSPEPYLEAVKQVVVDEQGSCLRLEATSLANESVTKQIEASLEKLGINFGDTHLVIDFKNIVAGQEEIILLAFNQIITSIPSVEAWKSITFAATAFPKDLSGITGDSIEKIPRTEWKIWKMIEATKEKYQNTIGFGDYAISHPETVEIDPRIMSMSANIRYAADEDWVILKGRGVKKNGYGQFVTLSKALVKMPEYAGESFSKGDSFINDCANGDSSTGNAQTWRRVGVNHHLAKVVDQLSKMGAV